MLLAYGHAKMEWQGVEYTLAPTFANIAKIGSPSEIVEDFKSFITTINPAYKFNIALSVLRACCDKDLPEGFTGRTTFMSGKLKYVQPSHGVNVFSDIITLAEHCLIHGVCGKVKKTDKDESGDSKPIKEFDAYEFMELSRVHLGVSRVEAENLTMTEFIRMMKAKFPEPVDENKASRSEEKSMLDWYFDKEKAH